MTATEPAAAPPVEFDPEAHFEGFYANPIVRDIYDLPRWTVSGQIGPLRENDDDGAKDATRKAPIDMRELLDRGRVRGAFEISDTCLVTLDELSTRLPLAANCAFYLRAAEDDVVILDIEPSCPPQIAAKLLEIPGVRYSEVSMSGRGFHLVLALPENFHEHHIAAQKRVLRHPQGWFELLLDHWVTFTRRPIDQDRWMELDAAAEDQPLDLNERQQRAMDELLSSSHMETPESLYEFLASTTPAQLGVSTAAIAIEDDHEIPFADKIVDSALAKAEQWFKEPSDFDDDLSRWEFSVIAILIPSIEREVAVFRTTNRVTYSDSDIAHLLHRAAARAIPSRPKHHEMRHGRPYLLERCLQAIALRAQKS